MNWQGWLAALIVCTGLTGCLDSKSTRPADWLERLRPSGGPSGPNSLFIEYALIERPEGDPKLDKEIWTEADEQVVAVESRALIERNGYRVGRFGNILPSALQGMLTNPQTDLGHRQRRLYFDSEFKLAVSKPIPNCELQLQGLDMSDGDKLQFADAEFSLVLTARKEGEDKISLEFVPEVGFTDKSGSNLAIWSSNKTTSRFGQLAWKISVGPNEHLLIGCSPMRSQTIGQQSFIIPDGKDGRQRILLLKAGRLQQDTHGLDMGKETTALVNQASLMRPKIGE